MKSSTTKGTTLIRPESDCQVNMLNPAAHHSACPRMPLVTFYLWMGGYSIFFSKWKQRGSTLQIMRSTCAALMSRGHTSSYVLSGTSNTSQRVMELHVAKEHRCAGMGWFCGLLLLYQVVTNWFWSCQGQVPALAWLSPMAAWCVGPGGWDFLIQVETYHYSTDGDGASPGHSVHPSPTNHPYCTAHSAHSAFTALCSPVSPVSLCSVCNICSLSKPCLWSLMCSLLHWGWRCPRVPSSLQWGTKGGGGGGV